MLIRKWVVRATGVRSLPYHPSCFMIIFWGWCVALSGLIQGLGTEAGFLLPNTNAMIRATLVYGSLGQRVFSFTFNSSNLATGLIVLVRCKAFILRIRSRFQ